jgi:hypothetical protein
MTIEEFDNKSEIRKTIESIDKVLGEYKRRETCETNRCDFLGVGVSYWCFGIRSYYIEDDILADRFKEMLLQRKQELIDEFCKE